MALFKVTILTAPHLPARCLIVDVERQEEAQGRALEEDRSLRRWLEAVYTIEPFSPTPSPGEFWIVRFRGRSPLRVFQASGEVRMQRHCRAFHECVEYRRREGPSSSLCWAGLGEDAFNTEAEATALVLRIARARLDDILREHARLGEQIPELRALIARHGA